MTAEVIFLDVEDEPLFLQEEGDDVFLSQGEGGPQGAAGLSGGLTIVGVVGEAVILASQVCCQVPGGAIVLADKDTASRVDVIGLAATTETLGETIGVSAFGEFSNITWSWTEGALIFLANTGGLTQVAPTTGFVVIVGLATSPTKIMIRPETPIELVP